MKSRRKQQIYPICLKHPAHFTDHFRLIGLRQSLGTWVDLDIVFLKNLPHEPHLMGWENATSVTNAILRLPNDSPILNEYIAICEKRPFNVAWLPFRQKMRRNLMRFTHPLQGKMVTPVLGPITLTHLVKKHGLASLVKPKSVFYPIPYGRSSIERIGDPDYIERFIAPETVAIHLWRSWFRKVYGSRVPGHWLRAQIDLYCPGADNC